MCNLVPEARPPGELRWRVCAPPGQRNACPTSVLQFGFWCDFELTCIDEIARCVVVIGTVSAFPHAAGSRYDVCTSRCATGAPVLLHNWLCGARVSGVLLMCSGGLLSCL